MIATLQATTALSPSCTHLIAHPTIRLTRILVPLDFSPTSLAALDYSARLARQFGAALRLVHVVEPPSFPNAFADGNLASCNEAIARRARTRLVALARRRTSPLLPVTPEVRVGKPWWEIVSAARESGADLIVIATHGRTGWRHAVLGSNAERVVRHASCPVLVVHRDATGCQESA